MTTTKVRADSHSVISTHRGTGFGDPQFTSVNLLLTEWNAAKYGELPHGRFGPKKLQEQSYDYRQLSNFVGSIMMLLSETNRQTIKSVTRAMSSGSLMG